MDWGGAQPWGAEDLFHSITEHLHRWKTKSAGTDEVSHLATATSFPLLLQVWNMHQALGLGKSQTLRWLYWPEIQMWKEPVLSPGLLHIWGALKCT